MGAELKADYTDPAVQARLDWAKDYKTRAVAQEPEHGLVFAQLATAEEIGRLADAVESLVRLFDGGASGRAFIETRAI